MSLINEGSIDIWKEDFLLFPMTTKVLSPADLESLSIEFEKVEDSLRKGNHQRLEHFAEELAQKLQIG